ncbi:consortin isoform X2 [Parambassis ranga]|uniref:Consortin isoform X2 n=1 Tax=Parambassis ranga TaxID=210632 RepID=A0A6P7I0F9_9TELE|nr:consortin isoform X2 [Parambassis ranga]
MDHGQFEREGRVMSQVHVCGVELCDNLPNPEALTAQTRNLNQTNTLAQTQRLPSSKNEEGGRCGLVQKSSLNNNGKEDKVEQGKESYEERSSEKDEEEDVDEVMEEESEESSCVIRCQSPGTPMTDSSYSETGSLLEAPYPPSPGTSPEPTSPVIPVPSPDSVYPIGAVVLSQSDADVDTDFSNTGLGASTTGSINCTHGPNFTVGPIDSTSQTITSSTWPTSPTGPTCIAESTDRIAKTTNSTTEHLTSSTDPAFICWPTCAGESASSYAVPTTAAALTALTTLNNPECAITESFMFTAGPTTTSTESIASSISSNWEHITSTPVITCSSVNTCTTGPIPKPALLDSLGQLAQKGDDIRLPQYLHQIAEAFVLHEDYQRALWCIQLERLYHQRVLDNLDTLQEQWESHCTRSCSDLATRHLDTLKHICQTHCWPRRRDAEDKSLDILRPHIEELLSCSLAHRVLEGMEQRPEDSSCPVMPSINLPDRLTFPEISEEGREDPDGFHGSQLTDKPGDDREGAEAEGDVGHTISVKGNGLHPSTTGGMDQSTAAEQQEGLVSALKEEAEEETDVEEAAEALEMEDEGEEEEEERQRERDSPLSQKAVPVETLVSGADLEVQQLHQDATAQDKLHEETQHCQITQEAHAPQGPDIKQQEQDMKERGEEEEEYNVDQADIIREAHTLDDMAKLITVEMSPASGLVSILKKRSICVDNVSVSASSGPQPEKPTAKRRVRFRVPDDSYEHDVGGGDSCLLLFLLCLVTVVISVGGTALYCALGDAQSSVCQDFSRNADFYIGQVQRGIAQIQLWFNPGS